MKAPPRRSWANVARTALKGYNLSYIPPTRLNDKLVVNLFEEVLEATDPFWFDCVVRYFVGKKLPYKLIESALKHAWGNKLVDMMANDQGFYFFHILGSDFRRKVLDGGLLTVARVPLILQQWHPLLELKKDHHTSVPVWVRLKNIPYALW
ncbi:hypothetical protein BT93_L4154 [Corymbia citriodora subsp. variegata]|uniref:DUF4283 domain-containing protein n=1 Tax=Corymbia citriodora subsp. variegata TaxID=360336 RepID=A0A8T0CUL3_CORYI|nr:hypothetical protein BT93_L4154 [Corymbia citriodora subsp. variegata]